MRVGEILSTVDGRLATAVAVRCIRRKSAGCAIRDPGGAEMASYTRLIHNAVHAVRETFQSRLAGGLQSSRNFILPEESDQVTGNSEFELITWLVLLDPSAH